MRVPNKDVAKFVSCSFYEAFQKRNQVPYKDNNPLRSSYFVSLIGNKLETHFSDKNTSTHYLSVNSNNKKEKGEWLFDICVTSTLDIVDNRHKDGISSINTNLLFACESELDTSLSAFTTDFGKLICSNSNQYLYVQGLNQSTEKGRKDFIESRKEMIQTQLFNLIRNDFVLAFIPTPGKVGSGSFWDTHEKDVLNWASIWIYSASGNDFVEYKINYDELCS
jgi:hypothetical protein